MRPLFFILLSFIYVFGDADPLELPATTRGCTQAETDSCPGKFCSIDFDGIKHCVGYAEDTHMVYTDNPNDKPSTPQTLGGHRDVNKDVDKDGKNILKLRSNFKRVFGDMDVIGATVIIPKDDGYDFIPRLNTAGEDGLTQISQVIPKKYVNEVSGLGTAKFPNSSRATFTFSHKSEHERKYVDGSKIKYARLYWGGSIYKEWKLKDKLLSGLFDNIFGYSSVRFKTPDDSVHLIVAKPEDIKWSSSFTMYSPTTVTRDTFYTLCRSKSDPNKIGGCGTDDYTVALFKDGLNQPQKSNIGGRSGMYFVYQASADVTDLVKASLGANPDDLIPEKRTFAVGGIASTIEQTKPNQYTFKIHNEDRYIEIKRGTVLYVDGDWSSAYLPSQYGGWSLVIVYDFGNEGKKKGITPKAVNIYDGLSMVEPTEKTNGLDLKFEEFFTPTTGDVTSSLALLGFGGRPEIDGEDILISNKGKENKFESITSTTNPKGKQFNSSITRYDEVVKGRKFNTLMDLDIFDISKFMDVKQKKVELKFKAAAQKDANQNYQGDRLNIGMVAFSTQLFDPLVCYVEKMQVQENGQWVDVAVKGVTYPADKKTTTKAKPGDKIRTVVTVQNQGKEDAYNTFLLAQYDPEFIKYEKDSSCLTANRDNGSIDTSCDKLKDSIAEDGRVIVTSNNILKYVVGEGAGKDEKTKKVSAGKLKANSANFARVGFVGVVQEKYVKTEYGIEFENSAIGLKYKDKIPECERQEYIFRVGTEEENNFYPRSKKNDPTGNFKNRLFTKIANKPFDITISNYDKTSGAPKAPDSDTKVSMELVESCSSGSSAVIPKVDYDFTKTTHTITKQITVPRPYKKLYVRLTYNDKALVDGKNINLPKVKCEEFDSFAVRPAKFKLYDAIKKSEYISEGKTLIGGKSYDGIVLGAYNENDTLANGYTNTVNANETSMSESHPDYKKSSDIRLVSAKADGSDCFIPEAITDKKNNKFRISFNDPENAVGVISKLAEPGDTEDGGFSFSDIGDVRFYVNDATYTKYDQHGSDSDCAIGKSHYNAEDSDGKFGCNIELETQKFYFGPEYLDVSDFEIIPGEFSYISSDETAWSPMLKFKVKAMLYNGKPALLYQNGCYAKSAAFQIRVGDIIADYTDNNGSKLSNDIDGIKKLNSEIMFFGTNDTNALVRKVNSSPHDGVYEIKKEAFKFSSSGKTAAEVTVKFNFKREKNIPKNPFEVTSDIFTFVKPTDDGTSTISTYKNLVEDEHNTNKAYKKPTTKTSAKFYYGRVYAPYYEGPNTGFKAKIYYGVYCNGCDESKFMLQKPGASGRWSEFADTHSWYVNPLHSSAYGEVNNYTYTNENSRTVEDTTKRTSPVDGISYIFVSNPRAVTDVAKMHTEEWLIYNEFNKEAKTNDFTLRFLVPNGEWAGKVLKNNSQQDKTDTAVGNVVGAEENFKDLSDKTNRRISW